MKKLTRSNFDLLNLTKFTPQLAQEIKIKLKLKSALSLIFTAFVWQFSLAILALGKLPDIKNSQDLNLVELEQFSRYCTGATGDLVTNQQQLLCIQDLHNHWIINWQLFWFDIFAIISGISITLLIVVGTYLIASNLRREQQQGTLKLIALAPQPAIGFFLGKIIGIPILLYGFLALSIPLHLIAGLQAGIPASLIFAFYLAIMASCAFFYSLGFFVVYQNFPSKNSGSNRNLAVLITMAIACFCLLTTSLNHTIQHQTLGNVSDWLLLFNPLNLILYLGQITALPVHYFSYLPFDLLSTISSRFEPNQFPQSNSIGLANISFYGQSLQQSIGLGIGLIIANFLMGAYWFWQGIKRRFYNPEQSSISKKQSYWLSFQVSVFALGLTLNNNHSQTLVNNFGWLICLLTIFSLILIFSLSPGHYQLQDWLHNRKTSFYDRENFGQLQHTSQDSDFSQPSYSLWLDLILGESSPANLAIALNLLIITCYVTPSLIIFPLNHQTFSILSRLTWQLSLIFLFATLWQWLKLKYQGTKFANKSQLLLGVFAPLAIATNLTLISPGLISRFIPLAVGIISQWLAIILVTEKTMKRVLNDTQPIQTRKIRGNQKHLSSTASTNQQNK